MTDCKRLAAFDFDSTICSENSDVIVRNLLPSDVVAKYETCHKCDTNGWTQYMQGIFDLLYSNDIDEALITKTINEIPPVDGMVELIQKLDKLNYDIIIISDANSFFINTWLRTYDLLKYVKEIFTNPGEFRTGLLTIKMYHMQDTCPLSTINLCKGQVLDDFIKSRRLAGVVYENVMFAGDGSNDVCPMLHLNIGDLAFCRQGFHCASIVSNIMKGQPYKNQIYDMKASVFKWNNGFDILKIVTNS